MIIGLIISLKELKMNKLAILLFVSIFILFVSAKNTFVGISKRDNFKTLNKSIIFIDLKDEKQIIENFGASDCWSTKFIGNWENTKKKNLIADYLFSNDTTANGTPKGIGLSLWRFNIGAGSFEQGAESGIADDYRREECFLNANETYNWSKQKGQQWFLQAAKKRGLNNFLAFSVSPPVQYTTNGKAYGLGTMHLNLKPQYQNNFANFLVNVVQHFNKEGYNMQYLSPFNEPQWNWGDKKPTQEGTAATNTEISNFIKILAPKLKASNSSTTITLGEAAQWNFLNANSKLERDNQLDEFFNPNASNYVGNVPNLEKLISAHSYFTTCPDSTLISYRLEAFNQKNKVNPELRLWQSEFGILGKICNELSGSPKNTGIDYGLYVAKVIHHDLAIANVSAWQWWLAVNPYNYSDGLVYINDLSGGNNLNSMKKDGIVSDSKQLWCLGNYARFIKPGMQRVGATLKSSENNLPLITAYKDKKSKKMVIVIVNNQPSNQNLSIDQSNFKLTNSKLKAYTTSASKSLTNSFMDASKILIPAQSVVTLLGDYK